MNEEESILYYYNTGKIPPLSITNWQIVYSIVTQAGYSKIFNLGGKVCK